MTATCIVVTGASKGIGAAIARHLAESGRLVACLSRSGDLPAGASGSALAERFIPLQADVTDPDAMNRAFTDVRSRGHSIAGLVNNAGVHLEGPSATFPLDKWNEMLAMNATSVLTGCQAAYPHLVANGGGLIVNIGSFFDKLGVKRNLAYCAAKAAVGAITRCLAVEWASDHIGVVDVAPGYITTDLNRQAMTAGPLQRYLAKRIPGGSAGEADDIGRFVATLFTLKGGFLTGETIYIDGAQGIAH